MKELMAFYCKYGAIESILMFSLWYPCYEENIGQLEAFCFSHLGAYVMKKLSACYFMYRSAKAIWCSHFGFPVVKKLIACYCKYRAAESILMFSLWCAERNTSTMKLGKVWTAGFTYNCNQTDDILLDSNGEKCYN